MKKRNVVLFLLLIMSANLFALGAGVTSLNFLKISQGARQSGMGEAFAGIADDVNALYWNPAGLTQLTRHQICLMHSVWLLDVNFEYGAYAIPLHGMGTVGIYAVFLNAGDIFKTTEDIYGMYQATDEVVGASAYNVSIAFAKQLSDFFGLNSIVSDYSVALNVNVSNEDIAGDSGGGFGFNLSTFYNPKYANHSFGLVLENVGFANNRPSFPMAIKMGFGYRFNLENAMIPFTQEGYFTILDNNAAADIDVAIYPIEQIVRVNVGAEKYWDLNKYHTVVARLGYKFGVDLGALAGLTLGAGYRLVAGTNNFDLDYSMNPYGDLGISHRISLTGKFLGVPENQYKSNTAEAKKYYKIGYNLLYKRKYSLALEAFSESLKRDRTYSSSYIGIGSCFLNLGKKELAMKSYEKALEYNPSNEKLKNFINRTKWGM